MLPKRAKMPISLIAPTKPHRNQQRIRQSKARFKVVSCGRRFGKTDFGKLEIFDRVMRGQKCWWLAPTYTTSNAVWRELLAVFKPILPYCEVDRSQPPFIELPNGGYLSVRSTHKEDNLRGAGLDFVVLDEAAYMSPTVWHGVVRPMLLTTFGSALLLSSPKGQNWFWQVYSLGNDPEETDWENFHFTSYDNAAIEQKRLHAELEKIKRQTPERQWREEYMAEFLSDSGRVFRNVRERAIVPLERVYNASHRYIIGVDWAKDNDYTALVVFDATKNEVVDIDRFHEIGWSFQRGRLVAMIEKWKPAAVWAEANSIGSPNIEALQNEGHPIYPFMTTATSKPPLIEGFGLAIESGKLSLLQGKLYTSDETNEEKLRRHLNAEVMIHELISYELQRLKGGGYRYAAPEGGHDDTVMAGAIAWHGAQAGTLQVY
jgi:hypothetical protein